MPRQTQSDYWTKRTLQLEEAMHQRGVEYFHKLKEEYLKAERGTRDKLAPLYARLAENNDLSIQGAKKLLADDELREFRWTLDEYIANARTDAWSKEVENAAMKYRISRLEAMRIHMQHHAEVLMADELDTFDSLMADIYTEGYYRSMYNIETGSGLGHNFAKLSRRTVDKVLSKPWLPDGSNFSARIWGKHRPQLINDLHTGLTQSLLKGESYSKLANKISTKYGVALGRADALVKTEGAYFTSVSQQDAYREQEVEYQQFSAVLDMRTSEICRAMSGKIIRTCDIEIGRNAPPLHCRCRSTMIPYFEGNIKTRNARDANGNNITVDGNMTYEDWYKEFVENKS